ncbi:MAG: hypothetical protein V7609_2070 [Verrucomicrobiota bacterium]
MRRGEIRVYDSAGQRPRCGRISMIVLREGARDYWSIVIPTIATQASKPLAAEDFAAVSHSAPV